MSPTNRPGRFELWALLLPTALGALLGVLPHLAQRIVQGTWLFLADNDDFYYSMIARAPFFGGWVLRDPFANARENIGVSYPWGLFVPMAKFAALFGDTPGGFLVAWRAVGGALLGLGLWFLLRTIVGRCRSRFAPLAGPWGLPFLCALLAMLVLLDPGFDHASVPFERFVQVGQDLLMHRTPTPKSGLYAHLRVVSPLCGIGLLFALLAVLSKPRLNLRSAVLGGILLGLLFNVYFFFWTAAVASVLVLVVVRFLPGAVRRWLGVHQPVRFLLLVLGIGLAMGLPQLRSDFAHFGDPTIREALERTPRGLAISVHNPMHWIYLTSPRLWLACIVVSFAALRVRALRVIALVSLVSFGLANSAVFTGLEFENYKWLHAPQTLSYLVCWLWGGYETIGLLRRRGFVAFRAIRGGLILALGCAAIPASIWIFRETTISPEAAERTRWQKEFGAIRPFVASLDPNVSIAAPREAQPALLSVRSGVLYQAPQMNSSFISDAELVERHVLNAWVLGEDRSQLVATSCLRPSVIGETRPRWSHLQSDYQRAIANVQSTDLDKFFVKYAMHRCAAPPTPETGPWREIARSGRWCIWERPLG